jgi:hypothetical protein
MLRTSSTLGTLVCTHEICSRYTRCQFEYPQLWLVADSLFGGVHGNYQLSSSRADLVCD